MLLKLLVSLILICSFESVVFGEPIFTPKFNSPKQETATPFSLARKFCSSTTNDFNQGFDLFPLFRFGSRFPWLKQLGLTICETIPYSTNIIGLSGYLWVKATAIFEFPVCFNSAISSSDINFIQITGGIRQLVLANIYYYSNFDFRWKCSWESTILFGLLIDW